jgi:diguanylate cyclase (GGDEF)-like protein
MKNAIRQLLNSIAFYFEKKRGVVSRQQFDREVTRWTSKNQTDGSDFSFFIFSVEIDRYRWIENSLGYQVGEQVLHEVSCRLKKVLPLKSLITKNSGEQFILFVPKKEMSVGHIQLAMNIQATLDESFVINDREVSITCCIGISSCPEQGLSVQSLISKASYALYQAKEFGRNKCFTFRSSDEEKIQRNIIMERELRKAMRLNQLSVQYQPQISIETGKICGAEALLRWSHPVLGKISPAEFIPLAEETGLICQMGEWVLDRAIKQFKQWETAGVLIDSISVNVSMAEFLNDSLLASLKTTLSKYEMKPNRLKLEVTESMAMNKINTVLKKLDQLKKLGVQLALDDFGTGYSSLHYLSVFPIDYLKVDQSFVRPIKSADQEAVITKSIIQMAKGLNLRIVAEGVETNEQLLYVKKLGCDEYQGYFHSPPLTAEAFKRNYQKNEKLLKYHAKS